MSFPSLKDQQPPLDGTTGIIRGSHQNPKWYLDAACFNHVPKPGIRMPRGIQEASSMNVFKHHLKTSLFNLAFNHSIL